MWSETQEFPSPKKPIVSQQPTQPLVDQVAKPISNLVDPTLISESDPDVIEPMSHVVNPTLPCYCNCKFRMYSFVYLMYYTPMFIPGCVCNVIDSCHALMFRSGVSIM